ncbi:MAG: sulfoxide reductase heme-binding subunit YedZ [Gammaproteobacteria bacterium]|nr:sulfoxide reductase heme-binding subunit YedZ [Gammaproteobacteria bacterium]
MSSRQRLLAIKTAIWLCCIAPLVWLGWHVFTNQLGANPLEVVIRHLGEWGLQLLLVTLCMTPLRDLSNESWPIQLRRLLGLWSFAYICLHFVAYLWLDQFFDWTEIGKDIVKRPFITVGMLAVLALLPLAITSTRAMQRRLGRRWKQLHRLVYVIVPLGTLHFYWLVKADTLRPLIFALCVGLLLGYRIVRRRLLQRPS